MEVINLISPDLPFARLDDSPDKVIGWMEEYRIAELPLVNQAGEYVGMVREEELLTMSVAETMQEVVSQAPLYLSDKVVAPHQHYYEALFFAEEHQVEVIPIVTKERHFEGSVLMKDAAIELSKKLHSSSPGAIVVLEVEAIHYSLAEISRLAESNNTKIMNLVVEQALNHPGFLMITLRFNTTDIKHTLATYQRFNYKIVEQYEQDDSAHSNLDRLNLLLKYLEF